MVKKAFLDELIKLGRRIKPKGWKPDCVGSEDSFRRLYRGAIGGLH